jgi:hypothetical protein
MIIALYNVSLTPNESLNRMIFNFSATAYEVAENTISNLEKFGIAEIGSYQSWASSESI